MNNPLQRAVSVALKSAVAMTRTEVVYRRGADYVRFDAGLGEFVFEIEAVDSSLIKEAETKDLIVTPLSLIDFGSGQVEPKAGDRFEIIEPISNKILTYEVAAPDPEPAWRYTDRFRSGYRIHGILIAEKNG